MSGGLSDIAFPFLIALEEKRPESLILQRAVLHYLRHERDWNALAERLAWMGDSLGDSLADLELCARAEQGQVALGGEEVSVALERLAATGGEVSGLAVGGIDRIPLPSFPDEEPVFVATAAGPVQVLSEAPVAIDDQIPTALPVDAATQAEAALEDQLPTVPAQSQREAGILPPIEGEDPPLDFEWDDEANDIPAVQGSIAELLEAAKSAELAGQTSEALSFLEAAAEQAPEDPAVQDAVASFLGRHPAA